MERFTDPLENTDINPEKEGGSHGEGRKEAEKEQAKQRLSFLIRNFKGPRKNNSLRIWETTERSTCVGITHLMWYMGRSTLLHISEMSNFGDKINTRKKKFPINVDPKIKQKQINYGR